MEEITSKFYTPSQVEAILQCSRSTVYKLMKEENLPEPVKFGARCRRWRVTEIDQWCEEHRNVKK